MSRIFRAKPARPPSSAFRLGVRLPGATTAAATAARYIVEVLQPPVATDFHSIFGEDGTGRLLQYAENGVFLGNDELVIPAGADLYLPLWRSGGGIVAGFSPSGGPAPGAYYWTDAATYHVIPAAGGASYMRVGAISPNGRFIAGAGDNAPFGAPDNVWIYDRSTDSFSVVHALSNAYVWERIIGVDNNGAALGLAYNGSPLVLTPFRLDASGLEWGTAPEGGFRQSFDSLADGTATLFVSTRYNESFEDVDFGIYAWDAGLQVLAESPYPDRPLFAQIAFRQISEDGSTFAFSCLDADYVNEAPAVWVRGQGFSQLPSPTGFTEVGIWLVNRDGSEIYGYAAPDSNYESQVAVRWRRVNSVSASTAPLKIRVSK